VSGCELKMKMFVLIFVLSVPLAAGVVIDCVFRSGNWALGDFYTCNLKSEPSITERGVVVTAATGNVDFMNHTRVAAFWSSSKTINFMPRLDSVFPNLVAIAIVHNHLTEIRQTDLQPYPKLKTLNFYGNDIETIEIDLFKFNPHLQDINLLDNKIRRVHPNVFDHLNDLRALNMEDNSCVTTGNEKDRPAVLELITKIKEQCSIEYRINEIKQEVTKISEQVEIQNENMKNQNENIKNQNEELASKIDDLNSKIDNIAKIIQDFMKIQLENDAKLAAIDDPQI
jgi:hypothetical protein